MEGGGCIPVQPLLLAGSVWVEEEKPVASVDVAAVDLISSAWPLGSEDYMSILTQAHDGQLVDLLLKVAFHVVSALLAV